MITTTYPTKPQHIRPYWHVDAKWIFGVMLFVSLGACLLVYNLAGLTVRSQAVPLSADIVSSLFGGSGINDSSSLNALKQQAASLPDNAILNPINEFPGIHITKAQLLNLTPSDLNANIFSQLTGAIYDKGLSGAAAALTNTPQEQQAFTSQASPLGLLTQANHDLLQHIWIALAVVSAVLLGLMVYFSAGWGRLVSPAMVTLAISPAGMLGGLILATLAAHQNPISSFVPSSVLQTFGVGMQHTYGIATLIAVGLLVVALIGKITQHFIKHRAASKPAFLKD